MFKNYLTAISNIGIKLKQENLNDFIKIIKKTIKNNKNIFICGNGGSASLSDHALCDLTKRLYPKTKCKVFDLTSNKSLISAIANDINFDDIFSYQINIFSNKGDICIFISSSGNSKNILKGMKTAKKKGLKVLAIIGFNGGKAKSLADYCIHFNTKFYEYHEDLAQITMHYIYQRLKK